MIRVPVTTGFPIITRGFETIRRPVFMIVSLCEPTEACKHGETGGLTRPQLPRARRCSPVYGARFTVRSFQRPVTGDRKPWTVDRNP